MSTTSPDGIFYPATSDTSGYQNNMANMAGTIQTAFTSYAALPPYTWADSAARAAQAGMALGYKGTQTDTGVEYRYNGSTWKVWSVAETAFTPTLTNVTIGTSTQVNAGSYSVASGRVFVRGQILLGTGGSVAAGGAQMSPPSGFNIDVIVSPNQQMFASGKVIDTGVAAYALYLEIVDLDSISIQVGNAGGTYIFGSNVTNTVPFTMGVGDRIIYEYSYIPV